MPKIPEAPEVHTPAPATLDFDLSGISLELHPEEKPAAGKHEAATPIADLHLPDIGTTEHQPLEMHIPEIQVPETHASLAAHAESDMLPDLGMHLDTGVDGEYSNSAEMATKLDLAVAYQEIGDKEGAREAARRSHEGRHSRAIGKSAQFACQAGVNLAISGLSQFSVFHINNGRPTARLFFQPLDSSCLT